MEVTCNLMGHIVDFQFPAGLGITNDDVIFKRRLRDGTKNYLPYEICIGDGAYRGCEHCLVKFPENYNQLWLPGAGGVRGKFIFFPLSPVQKRANKAISEVRQRVEHMMFLCLSKHKLFRLAYVGDYGPLVSAVHVACQFANLQIKLASANATPANGFSRYRDTIGPWRHDGL